MRVLSSIILFFSLCILTACKPAGGDDAFYVKLTVNALYDNEPIKGEVILYQKIQESRGPSGLTRGEGLVLDLTPEKRVYFALVARGTKSYFIESAMLDAFKPVYTQYFPDKDNLTIWDRLTYIPVGTRVQWVYQNHTRPGAGYPHRNVPLVFAFHDEADPATVFQVETEEPETVFGQPFELTSLYFERMPEGTKLTQRMLEVLPWIDQRHPIWQTEERAKQGGRALKPGLGEWKDAVFGQLLDVGDFYRPKRR